MALNGAAIAPRDEDSDPVPEDQPWTLGSSRLGGKGASKRMSRGQWRWIFGRVQRRLHRRIHFGRKSRSLPGQAQVDIRPRPATHSTPLWERRSLPDFLQMDRSRGNNIVVFRGRAVLEGVWEQGPCRGTLELVASPQGKAKVCRAVGLMETHDFTAPSFDFWVVLPLSTGLLPVPDHRVAAAINQSVRSTSYSVRNVKVRSHPFKRREDAGVFRLGMKQLEADPWAGRRVGAQNYPADWPAFRAARAVTNLHPIPARSWN